MIRIAVVDDDKKICEQIKKLLLEYQFKYECDFKVDTFLSCEELYQKLHTLGNYHLIFLDIEFPEMNGIDLSKQIRNKLDDIKTQIIFVSAVPNYAMSLFSVQPFDFLVKPITEKVLFPCLSKFIKYYGERNRFFTYTLENTKHKIPIGDIIYIKSERKFLNIHTVNGRIMCYHKFNDAINNELHDDFVVIKRGLAVNIYHIINADFDSVVMSNHEELTISDSRKTEVRERLSDKIGGV
ncbi:MAG: LytR/AlgR family response regulator transcription factor [Candidatus Gastranaerophilaceae bacterium]